MGASGDFGSARSFACWSGAAGASRTGGAGLILVIVGDDKAGTCSLVLTGETEVALYGAYSVTGAVGKGLRAPSSSIDSRSAGRFCKEGTGFRRGEVVDCVGKVCGGETAAIAASALSRCLAGELTRLGRSAGSLFHDETGQRAWVIREGRSVPR